MKVLTDQGAQIDTIAATGRLSFGIFSTLAEFGSVLIREHTMTGVRAARTRGRKGGRKLHCPEHNYAWPNPLWRTTTRRFQSFAKNWMCALSCSTDASIPTCPVP
ncbi:recombinase family protein [Tateyamaria sp.]|uniref:recombinase family protein n=1 Tax=Tateyamaria sp. TaxID=1929288 RepID=UPI0039B8E01F